MDKLKTEFNKNIFGNNYVELDVLSPLINYVYEYKRTPGQI